MGFLDQLKIVMREQMSPPKIILYSQPGIGKSTFAASMDALIIDCEDGCGSIDGAQVTPYLTKWLDIEAVLDEILALDPKKGPRVVAIDSLDWMMRRLVTHVCIDIDPDHEGSLLNTVGSAHGGWYKGRGIVTNFIQERLIPRLNGLSRAKRTVLLIAHARNATLKSAEGFDSNKAAPNVDDPWLDLFIQWADIVGYAYMSEKGNRGVQLQMSGSILAKNRYGLPASMPLVWDKIKAAIKAEPGHSGPKKPKKENK